MPTFNDFTKAFDKAVSGGNVDGAADAVVNYVKEHSEHTGKTLAESLGITQAWMGYDMGDNRAADTRNTPDGQKALSIATRTLGIKVPGG